MFNGDFYASLVNQVFDWTFEEGHMFAWNSHQFAFPDQVSIRNINSCEINHIETTSVSTSYSATLSGKAQSYSVGQDTGDIKVGVTYEGVGIEGTVRNSCMFGSSSSSSDYEEQKSSRRTRASISRVNARAFGVSFHTFHDNAELNAALNTHFVDEVKMFAANPTQAQAQQLWKQYGTHYLADIVMGGYAERTAYYEEKMDFHAIATHEETSTSSGADFFFYHAHQSHSSVEDVENSKGETTTAYTTGTTLVGGNSAAETGSEFCAFASLGEFWTPVVVQIESLEPLDSLFDSIEGVPSGTGAKMYEHIRSKLQEGADCARTYGGSPTKPAFGLCELDRYTMEWSPAIPVRCVSPADLKASFEDMPYDFGVTVRSVITGRKATLPGWAYRTGDDSWELSFDDECAPYENGDLIKHDDYVKSISYSFYFEGVTRVELYFYYGDVLAQEQSVLSIKESGQRFEWAIADVLEDLKQISVERKYVNEGNGAYAIWTIRIDGEVSYIKHKKACIRGTNGVQYSSVWSAEDCKKVCSGIPDCYGASYSTDGWWHSQGACHVALMGDATPPLEYPCGSSSTWEAYVKAGYDGYLPVVRQSAGVVSFCPSVGCKYTEGLDACMDYCENENCNLVNYCPTYNYWEKVVADPGICTDQKRCCIRKCTDHDTALEHRDNLGGWDVYVRPETWPPLQAVTTELTAPGPTGSEAGEVAYSLAQPWTAGVSSNCKTLGCTTEDDLATCRAKCTSEAECTVFNFCPKGASCGNFGPTNRCCLRECASADELDLVDRYLGWDVYVKDGKAFGDNSNVGGSDSGQPTPISGEGSNSGVYDKMDDVTCRKVKIEKNGMKRTYKTHNFAKAKSKCDELGSDCAGVIDKGCDGMGKYTLCKKSTKLKNKTGTCTYIKQQQ